MSIEEKPLADALTRLRVLDGVQGRSPDEPVEWETAYALCHILSSARTIEQQLVPTILGATSQDEAADALHEVREELRHILYHIGDASYFSVIASCPLSTQSRH
jgi:hypothetical protein